MTAFLGTNTMKNPLDHQTKEEKFVHRFVVVKCTVEGGADLSNTRVRFIMYFTFYTVLYTFCISYTLYVYNLYKKCITYTLYVLLIHFMYNLYTLCITIHFCITYTLYVWLIHFMYKSYILCITNHHFYYCSVHLNNSTIKLSCLLNIYDNVIFFCLILVIYHFLLFSILFFHET